MGNMTTDANGIPLQYVDGPSQKPPRLTIPYDVTTKVITLAQSAVPMGIANTGTLTAGGDLTLGTALNTTYSAGIWLYFPSTAFSTLGAGFYWTVMSSTTLGTVYTDITATQVAVGTGSSYTGDTTIRTAVSVTIPATSIGKNGSFRTQSGLSINNSAGAKTITNTFGGTSISSAVGTTALGLNSEIITHNRNATNSQVTAQLSVQNVTQTFTAIDTTADAVLTFRLTLAVATDVVVLECYLVELMYGV